VQVDYPYHFDSRDRTAEASEADHLRDLIEQVIFTSPGERVMRPDFGAGVSRLVFDAASPEAAATAGFVIRGALQQTLGQRILVEDVQASAEDATLTVTVVFRSLRSGLEDRVEVALGTGG